MSFRVWFLRMVWIVAAAVALGGCDKDDPKDNGDDDATPSLAVALDPASAAMGGATDSSDVKVTVTFANEAAADKTASVALTVVCDDDGITVADQDATDATDGVAAWDDVKVPLGVAGKCTFTAKATLGEEERSHSAEFTITAATPAPGGGDDEYALKITAPDADATDDVNDNKALAVMVEMTKGADAANLLTDVTVNLEVACVVNDAAVTTGVWSEARNNDDNTVAITWDVAKNAAFGGGKELLSEQQMKHDADVQQDCYIRAKAMVGSDNVLSGPVKIIVTS